METASYASASLRQKCAPNRGVIFFTDLGRTWLLTPLVDPDGSAISLQVTDGEVRSPLLDLELRPLPPPRRGAVEELRAELEDLLRAVTEAIGEDYPAVWEYWRDQGFNQMPVHLAPLVDAWLALVPASGMVGCTVESASVTAIAASRP